ncbi:hypothetical protein H9639_08130 [Arthrobacter sp. Sa2CUA1]|uniref:GNAT family N-acetyltransferase n=1 Tax=Arthrobacter gallicola TaxID=2762225 RepID=A0ABR8URU1_9MICC|nr:hypothetical protein [Arthrobacter gallicola]MBD7995261.1 hypothetical protein [Arthrobacter gallicola]
MGQLAASVEVVRHEAFTPALTDELRSLFDAEYLSDFGEWDPKQPYGYASHDIHLVARAAGDIVGHAGWARRTIMVGSRTVEVAGTGGVLFAAEA